MMPASRDAIREGDCPALKLELERNPEAPSLARAAIFGFCRGREWGPGAIATITLLVSEIVTNAVIHPDLDPPGTIGFSARCGEEVVRVEVSDRGRGFAPQPRDPDQLEGGYGLYLLEKEAECWGIESTPHTTVWFEVAAAPR